MSLSLPRLYPSGFLRLVSAGIPAACCLLVGCNRSDPPPAASPTTGAAAKTATAPVAKTTEIPASKAAAGNATQPPGAPAAARKGPTEAEREKARQSAAEMVPVETALVVRGPISAYLAFNSTLETEAMVDIYPQTTGQVEALHVEEGQVVREGEALLKIEDRELRVDTEESQANFEQLQRNFARTEDLYARKLINHQDFETQRNLLELARLRHERAKIRLAYTTVRAPFSGVIAAREVQVGARVAASTKLFSMVKLDETVARVFVPGKYLPIVAVDQPAVVTSEFLPDRTFTGWVKRISPVIDPKSGTFKVTVGVRGERPSDLPPGLFVHVRVITDTRASAVLVPKRAVIYEGGERFVFTIVNDRAVKRKLVPGYEDPVNIEAVSGFEVGAPVIVLGQSGLKDGSLVRSVNVARIAPAPEAAAGSAAPAPATPAAPVPAGKS